MIYLCLYTKCTGIGQGHSHFDLALMIALNQICAKIIKHSLQDVNHLASTC